MIRLRFVGQFDPEGEIMLGHHARWIEGKESHDPRKVAQELAALNDQQNRVNFPRFFTWTWSYPYEETAPVDLQRGGIFVRGINDPLEDALTGYRTRSEREEIFI